MHGLWSMSSFNMSLRVRVHEQREAIRQAAHRGPDEPIGIAPLGLALDDEGLAIDDELIVRARVGDLARPQLEVAVSAWMRVSPKPTIVSGRLAITRIVTGSPPAGV